VNDPLATQDCPPKEHWQLLFQQAFSAGYGPDAVFGEGLSNALKPLFITPELYDRMTASIRDAVVQALRIDAPVQDGMRVLLQVFVPIDADSASGSNRNWGFFWIKKTGDRSVAVVPGEQRIEVYLYQDGAVRPDAAKVPGTPCGRARF
jgi:hypothetical protein